MNVKIIETGEIKKLSIASENGIDWTSDLIGNAGEFVNGNFVYDYDADAYLASQDTYDWWAKYISDSDATDDDVKALAAELDIDEDVIREAITQRFTDYGVHDDLENHRQHAIQAMSDLKEEYAEEATAND